MDQATLLNPAFLRRYWAKVNKNGPVPDYRPDLGPCWIWTAAKDGGGYGRILIGSRGDKSRRLEGAHRISHEIHIGPILAKFQIDHLCRVRACVNPTHIEAVPLRVNIARGMTPQRNRERGLAQTHCKHGHLYTPENTYYRPGVTSRNCRICRQEEKRRRRAAAKLAA